MKNATQQENGEPQMSAFNEEPGEGLLRMIERVSPEEKEELRQELLAFADGVEKKSKGSKALAPSNPQVVDTDELRTILAEVFGTLKDNDSTGIVVSIGSFAYFIPKTDHGLAAKIAVAVSQGNKILGALFLKRRSDDVSGRYQPFQKYRNDEKAKMCLREVLDKMMTTSDEEKKSLVPKPPQLSCSHCGTKNPENSEYCYHCGRKMVTSSPVLQPNNTKSAEPLRRHPREYTLLHAALATHYGLFVDHTSYLELETRLLSDVQKRLVQGVPLHPDEMTLLAQINQAKDEEIKKAQNEAARTRGCDVQKLGQELQELEKQKQNENFRRAMLTAPMHLFFFRAVDRNGVTRFFDLMENENGFSVAESAITASRLARCTETTYAVPGTATVHHVHRLYGAYSKGDTPTARLGMDKFAKACGLTQVVEIAETFNAREAQPTWASFFQKLGCPAQNYSFKSTAEFTS